MTKRTIRIVGLGLSGLLGLLAIGVAIVTIALMRGPIHVGFLNLYAESAVANAFNQNGEGLSVTIADSIIVWDGEDNGVEFRAVNAMLVDAGGERLLEVPSISIRLSGWALLRGRLAPAGLEMTGARLRLYRGPNGGFALGLAGREDSGAEVPIGDILRQIVDGSSRNLASRYLESLTISGSRLEYQDPEGGRIFTADNVTILFEKQRDELSATATMDLVAGEARSRIELAGMIFPGQGTTEIEVGFSDLPPSLLGQIEPGLAAFGRLHVPVSGTLSAVIGEDAFVRSLTFELQGAEGWIDAPELSDEPLPVSFADLRGRIEDNFRTFTLDDFHLDFDGATALISGIVSLGDDEASAEIDLEASALPIEDIVNFLPTAGALSITRWVKEHLISGTIDTLTATFSATLALDGGPLTLDTISGRFEFSDAHWLYLKAMTPLTEMSGFGVMRNNRLTIESTHGRFDGTSVLVDRGVFEIENFHDPELQGRIDTTLSGPAAEAFGLIDQEPLHLMESMGIDPTSAGGEQTTHLQLTVPMRGRVGLPFIVYQSNSTLTDFSLADDSFGRPIAGGALSLSVNREELVVTGSMSYGGIPVVMSWTKLFGDDRAFRSQYEFSGRLGGRERQLLGIAFAPYVTGPIEFDLDFTRSATGSGNGSARLDFSETGLSLPTIQFNKEPGIAGSSEFDFTLDGNGVVTVPRVSIEAGGLSAEGNMSLNARDPYFMPLRINFDRFTHGLTTAHGSLDLRRGPLDPAREESAFEPDQASGAAREGRPGVSAELFIRGDRLDLRGAFAGILGLSGGGVGIPLRLVVGDPDPVGEVIISDTASLRNLIAIIEHDGTVWRNAHSVGSLGEQASLNIDLADQGAVRHLTLTTDDAGLALRAVGWFDTIQGGSMNVVAALPNPPSAEPIAGQVLIEDFDLVDAPVMARLLTLASLRGLAGSGDETLAFDDLTMDFRLIDQCVEFPTIRAAGDVVILARGTINRQRGTMDISGDVAPATFINSLGGITRLPGLRELFGESVFAATFRASGTADQPELTVNPLSVLTPGITRRIMEIISGGRAELASDLPSCVTAREPPLEQ